MKIKGSILSIVFLLVLTSPEAQQTTRPAKYTVSAAAPGKIWSVAKATAWYKQYRWITGANFIPSTAINQLEMWQADSFDPVTIDRELSWAESIGFNTMRVFLHSLAWKQDREGFKKRVDQYLAIASKHNIQTMFVFFDDCWNKVPQAGKQPEPKAGIHNSGWMQDPGYPLSFDSTYFPQLQKYVVDVMTRFKHDKRILLWDLYNEPGNSNKRDSSLPLLTKVFQWARSVNPDQPISSGVWDWSFEKLNQFQIANSDVVTYHDYEEPQWHARVIQLLKTHGRPLICTEYMARVRKSTFANTLPLLKKENVGAINWGLVAGKTNTMYAWDTPMPNGGEPADWFHEVFKKDGTPYRTAETDLIKKLNTE